MCGDGEVQGGESCDDGNDVDDDGCDVDCEVSAVTQLRVGRVHTCVLTRTGAVRCWGENWAGQLGYGHTNTIGDGPGEMPPPNVELGGKATQLVVGGLHSFAKLEDGRWVCWGYNELGGCGVGTADNVGDEPGEMPPPALELGGEIVDLAAGLAHNCALMGSGEVLCWGDNDHGQLGLEYTETIGDEAGEIPPVAVNVGMEVAGISAGEHTCALGTDGTLRCWGYNEYGQLGLGHTDDMGTSEGEMPPDVVPVGEAVVDVVASAEHTCVVLAAGRLKCWGWGDDGRLGYGTTETFGDEPGEIPPPDVNVGAEVVVVTTWAEHTCALDPVGDVRCWGRSDLGQLGDTGGPQEVPPKVVDMGGAVSVLAAGMDFTCALMESGEVRCWGIGGWLGLGDPYDTDGKTPAELPPVQVF